MTDDVALPAELADQHARLSRARAASRRLVARGLARRRLLPPLVVGSGAVLGSSAVGAWVIDQQPHAPAPAAPLAGTTTTPSGGDAQLSADIVALNRLAQTLAGDRAAIAALESAGASAPSATGTGATGGAAAHSAGATSESVPGPAAATSSPATSPPVPPLPALPTLPVVTVPPPPPPSVHTTTGATGVVH